MRRIRKGAAEAIRQFAEAAGGRIPAAVDDIVMAVARSGGTPLVVADGRACSASIRLKDVVKGGIRERFAQLRKMGVRTVMITGDNPLTAAAIAAEAGVDDFIAEAKPEDKLARIRQEQAGGQLIAMIGDGTNDAPALAQADVGVAMNTGTQAAREAGNMVDLDSNPTKLIEIVEIGKQLLMTRGALTTFSIANDVAKYFAILPAMFGLLYAASAGGHGPLASAEHHAPAFAGERDPQRGDFQRADHRRADPAGAARREVRADRRGGDPAQEHADLRRRRHCRSVHRDQTARPAPGGAARRVRKKGICMKRFLFQSIRLTLVFTVLTGLLYPLVVTGIAQWLFRDQAERQSGPT